MIEKDVFPKMAEEGVLYCLDYKGFWEDVGQPKDYLIGTEMILTYYKKNKPEMLAQGANIVGNVLLVKMASLSFSTLCPRFSFFLCVCVWRCRSNTIVF